jgi:heme oxygenase
MMDAVPPHTADALPARLRAATRGLHAAAERSPLMATLVAGRVTRLRYVALLASLHAIYAALERALAARADDPVVAALDAAPLARRPALERDLAALAAGPVEPAPAAQVYAARIDALAAHGSPALAAHAYVRYLGDLHGGQVLARQVARALGLADGEATAFYDFGPPERVQALRRRLRDALGRLPVDAQGADAIVAEACWGFEQHRVMFEQLA